MMQVQHTIADPDDSVNDSMYDRIPVEQFVSKLNVNLVRNVCVVLSFRPPERSHDAPLAKESTQYLWVFDDPIQNSDKTDCVRACGW